jgi:hypothetical protein
LVKTVLVMLLAHGMFRAEFGTCVSFSFQICFSRPP